MRASGPRVGGFLDCPEILHTRVPAQIVVHVFQSTRWHSIGRFVDK